MDNWEIYYRTHARGVDKELTGSLPLSFVSNGENLVDYRIDGASGGVGNRTANLWDEKSAVDTNIYIPPNGFQTEGTKGDRFLRNYISVNASTDYVFTWSENVLGTEDNTAYIRISEYTQNNEFISRTLCNCSTQTDNIFVFTTGINTVYIDMRIDSETSSRGQHLSGIMIVSELYCPTSYEPYGYKIPIVCGGITTNLYLDVPLDEGQSISMSDTGVSIPTINGSNTLSIGTTVQPSNMYIKYSNGGNINQSLMTYLEYKYNVAKE